MAATIPVSRPASNRRARVRQKVHVPAYATLSGVPQPDMLDLYEVLDISESGVSFQSSSPMEIDQTVELCLDLAEAEGQISGTARVIWSDASGRVGLRLPNLADPAKRQLSEWLFLNALAAAANAEAPASPFEDSEPGALRNISQASALRQNYTDALSAASAVQNEAESLGSNLEAVLALVASRARSLLRASGAAVALEEKKDKKPEDKKPEEETPDTMTCRATSGASAPPVGVTLQVGSGFSGECVRNGKLLRCDDTETDDRVDRQTCRALGIRSIIAVPVRVRERVVGLLEVFSAQASVFTENDSTILQRLAETIQTAIIRSARVHDFPAPPPPAPKSFSPPLGSVLFAHPPQNLLDEIENDEIENDEKEKKERSRSRDKVGGVRLPRAYLYLLFFAAAVIFLVMGFLAEPWLQEKLQGGRRIAEHTVLASSKPSSDATTPAAILSVDAANLAQLRDLADHGNPAAENALGLLFAAGDEKQGITRDEGAAARWFTKAAEHGSVPAQSKLGSLYWSGRGVRQDDNQAYFWTILARAGGDDASQALAPFIATRLTSAQRAAIQQEAEQWLERHESTAKPVASR
jgi:GAF domain-containing protein